MKCVKCPIRAFEKESTLVYRKMFQNVEVKYFEPMSECKQAQLNYHGHGLRVFFSHKFDTHLGHCVPNITTKQFNKDLSLLPVKSANIMKIMELMAIVIIGL